MTEGRSKAAATVLLDGDVLITGGAAGNGYPQATAELYNPAANTFTAVGNMTTSRFNHTASLLADGKVLIIGGEDGSEDQGVTVPASERSSIPPPRRSPLAAP